MNETRAPALSGGASSLALTPPRVRNPALRGPRPCPLPDPRVFAVKWEQECTFPCSSTSQDDTREVTSSPLGRPWE